MDDTSSTILILIAIGLVLFILVGIPMWRICTRAGFNPAWSLLVIIPYLGPMIVAARLGLSDWPNFRDTQGPGG
jgi:hypothetical protein